MSVIPDAFLCISPFGYEYLSEISISLDERHHVLRVEAGYTKLGRASTHGLEILARAKHGCVTTTSCPKTLMRGTAKARILYAFQF